MVDYQSFIREVGTWNSYSYSAVSYKQWTESNGAFHVRATATTTDGQVWNITYDKGSTQPIKGVENRMYRIADAAAALAGMAQTKVATVRGGNIDYAELAAANAAAMYHGSAATIDYDRMGEAVAQANRDAGVGQATIMMDKREVGRTVEPTVSGASAQRGTRTIAGRPAQLILA